MEFTPGRIAFVLFFIVVFIGGMILSYRKDMQIHKKYYKNSFWIVLFFVGFVVFLFILKLLLNF